MSTRILSIAAVSTLLVSPALAADLTVTLNDVQANGAPLYVGVQTEEQFMDWDGIAGQKVEAPEAGTHTFTFDLPAGEYSVSVWHDLNSNGEFDMSESGFPEEGWAMSNGSSLRGEPTFADVKVSVGAEGAAITETVRYPR
jgi:uncharacterized protein (DUF2141 family)